MADSVVAVIRRFALPAILAPLDQADYEQDPDDPTVQPFSGPPPLANRAYDGHGADPAAWYVQPTGGDFDWALAEFTSPTSGKRSSASRRLPGLR